MTKKRKYAIKPVGSVTIECEKINKEDYPVFCFKHLSDKSIKECKDADFYFDFLMRLRKLSELGWDGIRKSNRHSFGMETIPRRGIKPNLPSCITPDVKKLHVFRANGKNLPFVGIQIQNIFRVLFIEAQFGDIYNHE
jgi:hypothetical protein